MEFVLLTDDVYIEVLPNRPDPVLDQTGVDSLVVRCYRSRQLNRLVAVQKLDLEKS